MGIYNITYKIRLDKWLWHARFFKTRTLASRVVKSGTLRINGIKIRKGSSLTKLGDFLSFPKDNQIRTVQVLSLSDSRRSASEAITLYLDLSVENQYSLAKAKK
jgi:ribosome-associated heat shock protein Hsp15